MSDEHKITCLSTPFGPSILVDGREVPYPDEIQYEVPTNMTVLKYKGMPNFPNIEAGGGGQARATVKDGHIEVAIGGGGGLPREWGVLAYNNDEGENSE
jgi:hypothetical protein